MGAALHQAAESQNVTSNCSFSWMRNPSAQDCIFSVFTYTTCKLSSLIKSKLGLLGRCKKQYTLKMDLLAMRHIHKILLF